MDFIDKSLEDAPFSSKHILNFLRNEPLEDRPYDVPNFDWRDVFKMIDRVIRMLNQYGDVSKQCLGPRVPHSTRILVHFFDLLSVDFSFKVWL